MKILIVEDDYPSRLLLQGLLKNYGPVHIAVNGKDAIEEVAIALENEEPFDLICMDILMPEMDGKTALQEIRSMEKARGITLSNRVKTVMTTALDDLKNIMEAYNSMCDGYLAKPINKAQLLEELNKLNLIG